MARRSANVGGCPLTLIFALQPMLIINADDLGRCAVATDRIMVCLAANRIDAASVMVFMEDSRRAATLATSCGLDAGLHINFTESFTGPGVQSSLRRNHERIRRFLRAVSSRAVSLL